ncbi:MAG: S8 family serine peptidase, partial [Acidimicrobiales bacterium]|nr:S8 family serine peptidase [Acidimicrobiales bacterium]
VVRVDVHTTAAIEAFGRDHDLQVMEVLVESRGIAVFSAANPKDLEKDGRVLWAEPLDMGQLDDDGFHAWVQELGLDADRLDQADDDGFHAWDDDHPGAIADAECWVRFDGPSAQIQWMAVDGAKKYAVWADGRWLGRTKATSWNDGQATDGALYQVRPIFHGGVKGDRLDCVPDAGDAAHLGDGLEQLNLESAHRISDGSGTVVAILDTGVDPADPRLAGVLIDGWDFVDDDASPRDTGNGVDDDGDGHIDESVGHGTHVAGIVNQLAPGAKILAYRVLDGDGRGNFYAVAEAIDDAVAAGADVINLSFGGTKIKSDRFKQALQRAEQAGVVVIAAAGNDGVDKKQFPASEGGVLGVTAWDPEADALAGFANFGKWVDVAAPGVRVGSVLPNGRVAAWSGSSMAAPIVTGQAALIIALDPGIAPKDVEKAIRDTCRKLDKKVKNKPEKGVIDLLASVDRFAR